LVPGSNPGGPTTPRSRGAASLNLEDAAVNPSIVVYSLRGRNWPRRRKTLVWSWFSGLSSLSRRLIGRSLLIYLAAEKRLKCSASARLGPRLARDSSRGRRSGSAAPVVPTCHGVCALTRVSLGDDLSWVAWCQRRNILMWLDFGLTLRLGARRSLEGVRDVSLLVPSSCDRIESCANVDHHDRLPTQRSR
jgi:hypothetical protein